MVMDLNDAPEQRKFGDVIPDGTFVKLQLNIKAGGTTIPNMDPQDAGLFESSKKSDAVMLNCEFTVLQPREYEHRKVFERWVVSGGSVDDKGVSKGWNMSKARLRAMMESATGISPKDTSAQAQAMRRIPNFRALDNCPFYAKLTVEAGGFITDDAGHNTGKKYSDKNVIDYIVTPDEPEYAALRAGQPVEPKPRYSKGTQAAASSPSAWQGGAGAAAPPSAAKPAWQQQPGPQPAAAPPVNPAAPVAPQPTAPPGPAWLRS